MEIQNGRTRSGKTESILIFLILLTGLFIFNNLHNSSSETTGYNHPGISSTIGHEGLAGFIVQPIVLEKFRSTGRDISDKCTSYINSRTENRKTDRIVSQQITVCHEWENVPFASTMHRKFLFESDDLPDLT